MIEFVNKRKSLLNYLCAGFLLLLFVLYFFPFWNTGTSASSIARFVWWDCSNNTDLMQWFTLRTGIFSDINTIVSIPVIMFILSILCALISCLGAKHLLTGLASAACGAFGIYGYLATPYLPLGSMWQIHLAICIVVTIISLIMIITEIINKKDVISWNLILKIVLFIILSVVVIGLLIIPLVSYFIKYELYFLFYLVF